MADRQDSTQHAATKGRHGRAVNTSRDGMDGWHEQDRLQGRQDEGRQEQVGDMQAETQMTN